MSGAEPYAIVTATGIQPRHWRQGHQYLACPLCKRGPRDDRLTLWVNPDGHANWVCNRCGWKGHTREGSASREYQPVRKPDPPAPELDRESIQLAAMKLWRSTRTITPGDVASRYLRGRGAILPHPDGGLRWHPQVRHHKANHTGPALVALVTDPVTCDPITIHRTWIKQDGSGKAEIEHPRLWWYGLPKFGVCRLAPDEEITLGLAIAEGIETSLCLARAFGLAWVALDASNLAAFPVLDGVEALTIAVDNDKSGAGQKASIECATRWLRAGREVWIVPPDGIGTDIADIVQRITKGRAA